MRMRALVGTFVSVASLATIAVAADAVGPVHADGPPNSGTPWVVTIGDSAISGEAGRWAGNSSDPAQADALGDAAYLDAGQSLSLIHI